LKIIIIITSLEEDTHTLTHHTHTHKHTHSHKHTQSQTRTYTHRYTNALSHSCLRSPCNHYASIVTCDNSFYLQYLHCHLWIDLFTIPTGGGESQAGGCYPADKCFVSVLSISFLPITSAWIIYYCKTLLSLFLFLTWFFLLS